MQIEDIQTHLTQKGFNLPKLHALSCDEKLYKMALLQPSGTIEATDQLITSDLSSEKIENFLELVLNENCDLVIAPEYCIKWTAFRSAFARDLFPKDGQIWVMGMESVKWTELTSFWADHDQVTWIYDDSVENTDKLLDPLLYLFRAPKNGQKQLVGVVQFKTAPMGGTTFERDNLQFGKKIFSISGEGQPAKIYSILCADALAVDSNIINEISQGPALLIHPQLNSKPRDDQFSSYRQNAFKLANNELEVVCLNWANSTTFNGLEIDMSNCWGSGHYTKAPDCDVSDKKVNLHQHYGAYLNNVSRFKGVTTYFDPSENVFLLELTKPSQRLGPGQSSKRTGISEVSTLSWNGGLWAVIDLIESDFYSFCQDQNIVLDSFTEHGIVNYMQLERLFCLSAGLLDKEIWHKFHHMISLSPTAEEELRRLTVFIDHATSSKQFRDDNLAKFVALKDLIKDGGKIPEDLIGLTDGCTIDYRKDLLDFNLYSLEGTTPAVGVYIGDQINSAGAQEKYNEIYKCLSDPAKCRLVVWYKVGNNIDCIAKLEVPTITQDLSESPESFVRQP